MSTSIEFTQEQFDRFGRLSGDVNPIHVDPAFAARTRFGRTVAHGMLLFATLASAVARRSEGPIVIGGAELVFPAPTFAGVQHLLTLEDADQGRTKGRIETADGIVTADSIMWVDQVPDIVEPRAICETAHLGRLRLGDEASVTRRFNPEDTGELVELVDDPNPLHRSNDPMLSPALLGGLISYLLGMELPGPGTNWLKQRYRFLGSVPASAEITAAVEITRIRSEKHLVNLECAASIDDETIMTGQSLVLVRDVEHH